MAPPNRYTNSSISMTGRASAVISASTWRRERRTPRPASVRASAASSGMRALPAGELEEDVVEGGGVDREALDGRAVRIELVEQRAHVRRAAVRGHAQRPPRPILRQRA